MIDLLTFLNNFLVNEEALIAARFIIDGERATYGDKYLIRKSREGDIDPSFPFEIARKNGKVSGYGPTGFSRWYVSKGDIQINKLLSGGILVPQGVTLLCRSTEEEDADGPEEAIEWD